MKKEYMAVVVGGIALAVAVTLMLSLSPSPTAEATNTPGNTITDHALADGVADEAVGCGSDKSFTVYITMVAVKATTLTVSFVDDCCATGVVVDTLPFPLAAGQILNITQAAGGTPNVDTHLVVSGTAAGDLRGWMSISTQTGAKGFFAGPPGDFCRTYAVGAVPNAIDDDIL